MAGVILGLARSNSHARNNSHNRGISLRLVALIVLAAMVVGAVVTAAFGSEDSDSSDVTIEWVPNATVSSTVAVRPSWLAARKTRPSATAVTRPSSPTVAIDGLLVR